MDAYQSYCMAFVYAHKDQQTKRLHLLVQGSADPNTSAAEMQTITTLITCEQRPRLRLSRVTVLSLHVWPKDADAIVSISCAHVKKHSDRNANGVLLVMCVESLHRTH